MSRYLIAVDTDATGFRFDPRATISALVARWPDARVDEDNPVPGSRVEAVVTLPAPDPEPGACEIVLFSAGRGLSVEVVGREVAAQIIALVCTANTVPDDGSVVLVEWADDPVPLSAGITSRQLLAVAG